MHMADALISPEVGGAMWLGAGALTLHCSRRLRDQSGGEIVPLMGVLGAFVFAAQMINFAIPGTGSSGHIGGGLLLAILLGPQAAFIVIASVLGVQALLFADGGLLALGCNIINLGFYPAFVAYPLVYRALAGGKRSGRRAWCAAVFAAVIGLQFGALSVVLETKASGISDLPFGVFLLWMLPIHLAIGLIEGAATAAVVSFVAYARPQVLGGADVRAGGVGLRPLLLGLFSAALVMGGALSWLASSRPDGLEWSIAKLAGGSEMSAPAGEVHLRLSKLQQRTAILPDYGFRTASADAPGQASSGTSVSGMVGGLATLAAVWLLALGLKALRPGRQAAEARGGIASS
jgi:cobalt/nickel transport system permease protein